MKKIICYISANQCFFTIIQRRTFTTHPGRDTVLHMPRSTVGRDEDGYGGVHGGMGFGTRNAKG